MICLVIFIFKNLLFKIDRVKETIMESLEIFGVLLVILGAIGMAVMLKGRRPSHRSSRPSASSES